MNGILSAKLSAQRRVLCCAVLLAGCWSGGDLRRAQELATLTQAIDAVRAAPNDRKVAPLGELRALPCRSFCELKQSCVAAYGRQVDALGELSALRDALAVQRPPAAALDRLAEDLEQARRLALECAALQGETVRRWAPVP